MRTATPALVRAFVAFEGELAFEGLDDRFDDLAQGPQEADLAVAQGPQEHRLHQQRPRPSRRNRIHHRPRQRKRRGASVRVAGRSTVMPTSLRSASNALERQRLSAMRVWPGRARSAASIMSAQTSRSSAFAPARANATRSPAGVATRCSRRPQNQRECDAHQPYWAHPARPERFWVSRLVPHSTGVESTSHTSSCHDSHSRARHPMTPSDHLGAAPQPLVVAVAVRQIREPRPQMRSRVAHELRLVVEPQQRRDHRQGDQLRVRQLRSEPHHRPLRRPPRVLRQQVINPHIQCGREGVQVRAHAENLQDRSVNTHPELGHPHPTTGGPHPLELII